MGILWTILIGFVAGVIAKFIMPGDNEPSGFIMTTILGIVGAFVASYLGQALGWYSSGEGGVSWSGRWSDHCSDHIWPRRAPPYGLRASCSRRSGSPS
jgi:uncharacterized membrane protein YeaQ/YmgE (transglycosylase-associated protein family)